MDDITAFATLGLPPTTPFSLIRRRYFELARQHHPDKLVGITEEERKVHEEYFQKVTVAYHWLEQRGSKGTHKPSQHPEDWRSIWSRVEGLFQRPDVWDTMKTILKDTVVDVVQKVAERNKCQHRVKVPVTLEEVSQKKRKKLQLFLQHVPHPVRLILDCGNYPMTSSAHVIGGETHDIHITMILQAHPYLIYYEEGDVFEHRCRVSWYEYLKGTIREVVLPDGTTATLVIPPLPSLDEPLCVGCRALRGNGTLKTWVELANPSQQSWCGLDATEKELLLTHLNALCHMGSGLEK
jgi:hypothetical protein